MNPTCDHTKQIMLDKTGVCSACGKLVYDEDYFIRGKESGLSLYENYRWLPDLTIPMVQKIIDHCGITRDAGILDFGCSRGYVVRALRELGYNAVGVDVSKWAIDNADETVKEFCFHADDVDINGCDWIIAKDVLEHVPGVAETIDRFCAVAAIGIFAVVPLSDVDGSPYVVPDYDMDVTHIHRSRLPTWASSFMRSGWSVEARYRIQGIKDNYYKPGWETGNGFITAKRIACQ